MKNRDEIVSIMADELVNQWPNTIYNRIAAKVTADAMLSKVEEYLEPTIVWRTYRESDMTEGRGSMVVFGPVYTTEQAAWDAVNDLGGVMGRHPKTGCFPAGECQEYGLDTWQKYNAHFKAKGYSDAYGDYTVRPVKVEK